MRSCEENLARRAWASAYRRQQLAEQLLTQPTIQKVHGRFMRRALEREVERCQRLSQRLIAPQALAA
jgi:hypothetical protein